MDTWVSQASDNMEHAKAALGHVIAQTARERGLNCQSLAELLITECAQIEGLLQQRLERFSLATLLRYVGALDICLLNLDAALEQAYLNQGAAS